MNAQAAENAEVRKDAETMALMLAAETPIQETEAPTGEEV
jgi:hypothetical protein